MEGNNKRNSWPIDEKMILKGCLQYSGFSSLMIEFDGAILLCVSVKKYGSVI